MTGTKTIVQTWLDRCRATPEQTVLRQKRRGIWNSISWQDYHDAVLRIAAGLERAGLRRGEVVSIVSESRPEWLYVDMAAQALGCVSHGAYPTCSSLRLAHQLGLAGARLVFVDSVDQAAKILDVAHALPALERIVVFDVRGLRALEQRHAVGLREFMGEHAILDADRRRFERRAEETVAGELAILASTAGSSGAPRLAAITHDAALRRAASMQQAFDVRSGDRTMCFVPLANVAERMFSAVLPLLLDCEVHFPESPATVANDLREIQPDWIHAPPRFWEKLLARTESVAMLASPVSRRLFRDCTDVARGGWLTSLSRRHIRRAMGLARARTGYSGGAPAALSLRRWFAALGLPLVDLYESAETCGPALRQPLGAAGGDAALGTEIRIDAGNELALRAASLFAGYWDNGRVTPAAFTQDGWLRTGDAVDCEASELRVVGKLKDRLSARNGKTVSPAAIERELHANPYIANALVVGERADRCACLLALEMESVLSFAQSEGISFVDFAHLVRNEVVRALVQSQVDAVNKTLEDAEQVGSFAVLSDVPGPGDEVMTPTLRMQRAATLRRYEAEVRALVHT